MIWFVCSQMSPADKSIGQVFSGDSGRWLYRKCLKPLELSRAEVGLWSLDQGEVPSKSTDLVVAVGSPAKKALGDKSFVSIPHPAVVSKRYDSGETARKVARIHSVLKADEDAQTKWEGNWSSFVDPKGGRFVYQKHTRGKNVHYDLRLSAKNDSRAWGWTIVGGDTLSTKGEKAVPKKEHPADWLKMDRELPDESIMKIEASGTYKTGIVHDKLCELILTGLTGSDKPIRVVISSPGPNEAGVNQWVSKLPIEKRSLQERKSSAEITSGLGPSEKLIYDGRLVVAGSLQEKMFAPIAKALPEKQIVYGIVLDPYIVDAHGDWTPPSSVEAMAHDCAINGVDVGYMHQATDPGSKIVESWLEPYPTQEEYQKAMRNEPHVVSKRSFGSDFVHSGTWIIGVRLSDSLWSEYKDGNLNAFSPGGFGVREKISNSDMPAIEVLEYGPKTKVE